MHVAIAGNIGAGKTTLAHLLSKQYGWEVLPEAADTNPYLKDFYEDMPRWAFHVQIYFLTSRFQQVLQIAQYPHDVVQDRTIYEDAYIFARNLHDSGLMNERDYHTYLQMFESVMELVRPPDLLIYLEADLDKLMDQIRQRGRTYEKNISQDYIAALSEHYRQWTSNYDKGSLLVINVNELDYVRRPGDLQLIVQQIDATLSRTRH
jgi:deoxyadenosine/deoxycytidine kinase